MGTSGPRLVWGEVSSLTYIVVVCTYSPTYLMYLTLYVGMFVMYIPPYLCPIMYLIHLPPFSLPSCLVKGRTKEKKRRKKKEEKREKTRLCLTLPLGRRSGR
ncbi:hypothetical protein F5X96DRAFT_661906 [Biscogniauxia mediterranea]|nr:hypothetical protein F5X96DRAFT_661906 [Biscogniauxia mediterranea]